MQIPILSGIYSDDNADYRTSHPRNYVPVPKQQGISNGYLRPAPGIVEFTEGPGKDRGGIEWRGLCYRVMGSKLVSIARDGTVTEIGDVGDLVPSTVEGVSVSDGYVRLDFSFDYLAIASAGNLYLYDETTLTQVTDANLGAVLDVIWLDGYFATTDGEFIVVGELGDPFTVSPTKYGSSEIDPDPIIGLLEIRNEVAAINRHTIEFFDNVGGGIGIFPFARIDGAQIERGAIGRNAFCKFNDAIAFVGNGAKKEALSVWLGRNGSTTRIATREIDQILEEEGLSEIDKDFIPKSKKLKLETRIEEGHETLYMHLSTETWCYDLNASQFLGRPIWYTLDSGGPSTGDAKTAYLANSFTRVYDKWLSGNTKNSKIGCFDDSISSHFGVAIGWSFQTAIIYNEGNGFTVHEVKLQGLTGRAAIGDNPIIYTQFSNDTGETWSIPKPKKAGVNGKVKKRIEWARQGDTDEIRIQRFYGTSDAHTTFARLDMQLTPSAF